MSDPADDAKHGGRRGLAFGRYMYEPPCLSVSFPYAIRNLAVTYLYSASVQCASVQCAMCQCASGVSASNHFYALVKGHGNWLEAQARWPTVATPTGRVARRHRRSQPPVARRLEALPMASLGKTNVHITRHDKGVTAAVAGSHPRSPVDQLPPGGGARCPGPGGLSPATTRTRGCRMTTPYLCFPTEIGACAIAIIVNFFASNPTARRPSDPLPG